MDSDLNPNDPVINTASEYMYQMATVTYHTLHADTTVVLTEPVDYNGETFAAGENESVNDGRYWVDFYRSHPIEGAAREQIWSPTAHALIAEPGWAPRRRPPCSWAWHWWRCSPVRANLPVHRRRVLLGHTPETEPVPVLRTATVTA